MASVLRSGDQRATVATALSSRGGLVGAALLFTLIVSARRPAGLSASAAVALAVFVFGLVIWLTQAVSYMASAALIAGLLGVGLTVAPDPMSSTGTALRGMHAIRAVLGGFATPAVALMAVGLVIAVAMADTGLDRRIALHVLSLVEGQRTSLILVSVMLIGVLLGFVVPSAPGRVVALLPILHGVRSAFPSPSGRRFAGLLTIAAANVASITSIAVKTAAPQNLIAAGLLESMLGTGVTWGQWLMVAGPYALALWIVLYAVARRRIPDGLVAASGGSARLRSELASLGPVTWAEQRLLGLVSMTLFLWVTEGFLHKIDAGIVAVAVAVLILLPGVGVMDARTAAKRLPVGTIAVFGIGVSLGTTLIKSGAAGWLAASLAPRMAGEGISPVVTIAMLAAVSIAIHLGFTSATALTAALIPIVISFLQAGHSPVRLEWWIVLATQISINVNFVLPINAPQSMVAYATDTFTVGEFARIGVPLTLAAYLLLLVFAVTYWHWLGMS